MLSFLGLDDSSLPELKHTLQQNEISSETTKSRLGLKGRRVVVTSSCVDAVSTPIGSGVIDEGKLSLELGTTGIVYTPTRTPKPDRRLYLDLSPIEDLYLVGGGTAASGIFYDWIIQLLNKGKVDYKRCEQWARSSRPGSQGIIILPYILGERTPIFDMSARAVIFGLQQDHSRSDLVRAAMEGVAYSFLHHLRVLQEVGYEVTAGTITGGGAKSPLFREIVTDVLGIPLFYHPIVSTTVGTAFIGYMSAGMKNDWEGVKEWFMERKKLSPKTSNRQLYDGHFSIYLDLYKKHREDFTFLSKDQQN
jgi:xylulokinase